MENINLNNEKKEDNFFQKILVGNNHSINANPQDLEKNWAEFNKWFTNEINNNPVLKKNKEKNLEIAGQLVKNIPLILSFRSLERVLPSVVEQKAILSRKEAKRKHIVLPTTMGDFDSVVNLEDHISTYFGNIGSSLYGNNTFIINPEIIQQDSKNFFVLESDTNTFQGDIYKKDIKDSILPSNKFYEFMTNYIAAFYEKPSDYLILNSNEHKNYLFNIKAPYSHISEEEGACHSPEIRISKAIDLREIIGYINWNGSNQKDEELLKKLLPGVPIVSFNSKKEDFGKVVSDFYSKLK